MGRRLFSLQGLLAALITGWLLPFLIVGLTGLGAPRIVAGLGALLLALAIVYRLHPYVDEVAERLGARHRVALALFVCAALVAIVSSARLAVFMADPARVEYSFVPSDPFRVNHSCLSAYTESVRFAIARDRNIYDAREYRPRRLGHLVIDPFHYPPPFLLLPAAIDLVTADFWAFRAVWFLLQALTLAAGGVIVARWIGGESGAWAAAAIWLVLASPGVFHTLQMGNFQMTAMPLTMIALVLVSRPRVAASAAGASILAYAALAKIFPGILILFLLFARRWRTIATVAAASLLLCAATIAAFGWRPVADFVGHGLPEVASGAAFPQTESAVVVANNTSAYGLTVRLRTLGLTWLDAETGRLIASIYGVLVILLAAAAGWRARRVPATPEGRLAFAQLALALLSVASFRSPFVGVVYGYIATLWLLTLLAAGASTPLGRAGWLVAMAPIVASMYGHRSSAPSATTVALSALVFVAVLALNLWIIVRAIARGEPAAVAVRDQPSALSVSDGSTRVARRAGQNAASATAIVTNTMPRTNAPGS